MNVEFFKILFGGFLNFFFVLPSIRQHSRIGGAADEAVLNIVPTWVIHSSISHVDNHHFKKQVGRLKKVAHQHPLLTLTPTWVIFTPLQSCWRPPLQHGRRVGRLACIWSSATSFRPPPTWIIHSSVSHVDDLPFHMVGGLEGSHVFAHQRPLLTFPPLLLIPECLQSLQQLTTRSANCEIRHLS